MRAAVPRRAGAAATHRSCARRSACRGPPAAALRSDSAPSPSPRCTLPEARFPLRSLPLLVLRAPLTPGGSVCLHLHEPGYLALLEAAMAAPSRLLLIGSTGGGGGGEGGGAAGAAGGAGGLQLHHASLARVKEVRSIPRGGVRAVVQAEGRVELAAVALHGGGGGGSPAAAFHRADATAGIYDSVEPGEEREVRALEAQLRALQRDVQNLSQRFKVTETAAVMAASYWEAAPERLMATVSAASCGGGGADGGGGGPDPVFLDIADRAARLSFAALQALPHASADERAALAASAAAAMRMRSTVARLRHALDVATEARALLAARCALRSLTPSGE